MGHPEWVGDFLGYIRNERGYSEHTAVGYHEALAGLAGFCDGLDDGLGWDSIDEDVVRRWMADMMGRGARPATVKNRLSALRSFYRYLALTGRVAHNPTTRIVAPRADKPLPKFFRDDDVNRLLDSLRAQAFPDGGEPQYEAMRAYLIILLLYMTGMRVGELVGLDTGDVDLAGGRVKVTGKRNKQRIIPVGDEVTEAVKAYLPMRVAEIESQAARGRMPAEGAADALLLSATLRRCNESAMSAQVKALTGTVTTQQRRSAHVFRHTFATSMLNNGSDMQSVKELLGHASLATTQVYTHTNFEELRRIYADAHPRG